MVQKGWVLQVAHQGLHKAGVWPVLRLCRWPAAPPHQQTRGHHPRHPTGSASAPVEGGAGVAAGHGLQAATVGLPELSGFQQAGQPLRAAWTGCAPRIHMLKHSLQCRGVRRGGLWGQLGHEGGALGTGPAPSGEETRPLGPLLCFVPRGDVGSIVSKPGSRRSQEPSLPAPGS